MALEHSRGSRDVGEWVALIEACERAGVSIFVTTHGRCYDPSNGRDRRSLLEDAVDSEYESSKVSVRAKRSAAANAVAGKPNGPAPFGYRRVYDERTRVLVRQEPDPVEAPVVRELFKRVRAGHSFRAIALDYKARGVTTRTGKVWSAQHLRELVLAPCYIALRVHAPRVNGRRTRSYLHLDSAVKGTWPPLVDEADFYAVREMLMRPERKTSRPGRTKHLLSFVALCDVCGGPLSVTLRHESPQYQCHTAGHVRVDKVELEKLAEEAIIGYLSSPRQYPAVEDAERDDDELRKVRNELAGARADEREAKNALPTDLAEAQMFANLLRVETARVAELEEQERRLSTPSVLSDLLGGPGKDVKARWQAAPMSARKEAARMLLTDDMLGELRVARRRSRQHDARARCAARRR